MVYSFFDNNVTGTFFHLNQSKGKKYQAFLESLKICGLFNEYDTSKFLVTPFSFFEAIGAKIPRSSSIKHDQNLLAKLHLEIKNPSKKNGKIDGNSIDDLRADLLEKYENFYFSCIVLFQSSLNHTAYNQLYYTNTSLREDFEKRFCNIITNKDSYELFINRIALDSMYNYTLSRKEYPGNNNDYRDFLKWIHSAYLADIVHGIRDDLNIPQLRGLKFLWHDFKNEMIRQYPTYSGCKVSLEQFKENIKRVSKSIKLKDQKDLVDLELIHFSIVGRLENGSSKPVLCFTSDPYDKILTRVSLYKSLVFHALDAVKKREPNLIKKQSPGKIAFLDRTTGSVTEYVETKDVPPLLDILATTIIT